LEAGAFLVITGIASYFVFGSRVPLSYLIIPCIVYGTLRFQQEGAAAAIVVVAAMSIGMTTAGLGPSIQLSITEKLVSLMLFNASMAVAALVLATVVMEQSRSRETIQRTTATLRESLDQVAMMAATDPLTGLKNRREFDESLARLPREPFTVLAIDVDNLKWLNDDYGHEAGDALLRAVGNALAGLVRQGDVLARTGGDEFGVLLHRVGASEAADIAERMRCSMHGVSVPHGRARISIGWAAVDEGVDAQEAWNVADDNLFRAKREGRDRSLGCRYPSAEPAVHHRSEDRAMLSRLLDTRLGRAAFQPIAHLETGQVVGYEALLRLWPSLPDDSIDGVFRAAELTGRVRDLDWLSRRIAVHDARSLPESMLLFLNVSPAFLLNPLHEDVEQFLLLLRSESRPPETTVLEITERERIHDLERWRMVLGAHREHGIRFSLDDMGVGHSALEVLAASSPEFIKVAGTLTAAAPRCDATSVIQAVMAFALGSGAVVIAEGVENKDAREQMLELGVLYGQGNWIGAPVWEPATEKSLYGVAPDLVRER